MYSTLQLEHRASGLDSSQLAWFCRRSIRLKHKLKLCRTHSPVAAAAIYLFRAGLKEIRSLHLRHAAFVTDAVVTALTETCPSLTDINLSFCRYNISDTAVLAISQHCVLLSRLDLTCCMTITDVAVIDIARKLKILTNVNVRGCVLLTDRAALALVQECPVLTTLKLCFCHNTMHNGVWSERTACQTRQKS